MADINEILAAIEAEAAAATKGPWCVTIDGDIEFHRFYSVYEYATDESITGSFQGEANADFIAASRVNVPRLCAALRVALNQLEPLNHYHIKALDEIAAILAGEADRG